MSSLSICFGTVEGFAEMVRVFFTGRMLCDCMHGLPI